jgi:hypothetical protein
MHTRFKHPLADIEDEVRLLGERDELRRRDIAVPGQAPAQQRLGADDAAVAQINFWLVADHELVALDARRSLLFSISRSTAAAFISGE